MCVYVCLFMCMCVGVCVCVGTYVYVDASIGFTFIISEHTESLLLVFTNLLSLFFVHQNAISYSFLQLHE